MPALSAGPPRDADAVVFGAPWEAQAFALALALHERGVFTWPEFATALGAQIERARLAGEAGRSDTYYAHWLAAVEALVASKCAASGDELEACRDAWRRAAARTPHGQPIELRGGDRGDSMK